MLTELCAYLRNWFEDEKLFGTFTIEGGTIPALVDHVQQGQYYRIVGSVFNDGIHAFGELDLTAEEPFEGSVWPLRIPPSVISLADEISAWRAVYEVTDSKSMSPFNSESFAGYSYSKSSGGGVSGEVASPTNWQGVFAARLSPWRKL